MLLVLTLTSVIPPPSSKTRGRRGVKKGVKKEEKIKGWGTEKEKKKMRKGVEYIYKKRVKYRAERAKTEGER